MRDETLLGTYAEDQFKKNLENLIKTECFKSSTKEDINEHWDVGVKLTFDVKGLRKVNRKDNTTDENIHWVELKNTMGNKGWLYGDATHFAFETDDYWIVVEKFKLQEFIKNKLYFCQK
ncbi:MAG: hypothetical protein M0R03_07920 [Novosphingobium sp.]|nr:hypothetical protein [Novosphingobium sp.]